MKYVYIDDSIHDKGDFIISGIVFSDVDPDRYIIESLKRNGFDPEEDEYKSGLNYRKVPLMAKVRNDLKMIIRNHCKVSLVILPRNQRDKIGFETLKGLKQFIEANEIDNPLRVYIDQNYFSNKRIATDYVNSMRMHKHHFSFEQDSQEIRGIQLADLFAHTCSIMLLEEMGLVNKKVKAGNNSGYDPDMDIEIGFELWASIRYNFLSKEKSNYDYINEMPLYDVYPYGIYISEYCNKQLKEHSMNRFKDVYLGCIH